MILSAVRTPVGRYGGALAGMRPDDLAALASRARSSARASPPDEIEDVYLGCANQAGEDNRNVARMARAAGGAAAVGARVTVNRLCASGLVGGGRGVPRGGARARATCSWPAASSR